MNAETVKAIREITGHSQRAMADALGVSERAVRYWETGRRNVPEDVSDWLVDRLAEHDELVASAVDGVLDMADERGEDPDVVTLPYWRSQDELDEDGPGGDVGVIDARIREIAQALQREGIQVEFRNEATL